MKYCLRYSPISKYTDIADELTFTFNETKNQGLFQFLLNNKERFSNQRIIVYIPYIEYFLKWNVVNQVIYLKTDLDMNISVKFTDYVSALDETLQKLRENEIPYFFETRVLDWDTFYGLMYVGASDIYVVEEMCFQLNKLGPVAHANSISLRTFVNICQVKWKGLDTIKSFFMRPEDQIIYGAYLDVAEFYYEDAEEQDTYYKIYAKDKKWFGDLQEIIKGLNQPLDSRYITPSFGETRARCDRKCIKGERCNICTRTKETTEIIRKKLLREQKND